MDLSVSAMPFQQSVSSLIYAIVLTIPLLFGAVHPIVLGCYVALMLVGCGGWLLLNQNRQDLTLPSFWLVVPLLLVIFIILQSIPLPLDWVDVISPYRAERVRMVNELAGTQQQFIAISDNGRAGFYRSFFLISSDLLLSYAKATVGCQQKVFFYPGLMPCQCGDL